MAITVANVISRARGLLQDEDIDVQRFSDQAFVDALNDGLLETRKLRPDMFRDNLGDVPQYVTSDIAAATVISYEQMYVPALVIYVAGRIQLRDDESNNDGRATVFLNAFVAKLVGAAA